MLSVIWMSRNIIVLFVRILKQSFHQKLEIIWRQFTSLGSFSTHVRFVRKHWKEGMLWTFTSLPCIQKRSKILSHVPWMSKCFSSYLLANASWSWCSICGKKYWTIREHCFIYYCDHWKNELYSHNSSYFKKEEGWQTK